jgi:penicillin-binding protein 2
MFAGDPWRIGDTYTTSIGQYGTLATPLQVLRAIAAIANGGMLVEPTILLGDRATTRRVPIDAVNLEIVREGMRLAVTEGTATGLWFPFVSIAAKTGTAEIGISKKQVHSWVTGFFPYEKPRYAFVILLERGPAGNTIGAVSVAKAFFEWLAVYAPQYLE